MARYNSVGPLSASWKSISPMCIERRQWHPMIACLIQSDVNCDDVRYQEQIHVRCGVEDGASLILELSPGDGAGVDPARWPKFRVATPNSRELAFPTFSKRRRIIIDLDSSKHASLLADHDLIALPSYFLSSENRRFNRSSSNRLIVQVLTSRRLWWL